MIKIVIAFILYAISAHCGAVTLQWNVPVGDTRIDGYELHYGGQSGQYGAFVDVPGAATDTTIAPDPAAGQTFYYAVRSRNADASLVSAFSNEVLLTIPLDGALSPPTNLQIVVDQTPQINASLWTDADMPVMEDAGADNPVALGVQFSSDIPATVTGVRFYKSAANVGVHVGRLWTGDGVLLASEIFTDETPSGWQRVDFSTPMPIDANTVYTASYHCMEGHYSADAGYFSSPVASHPLYAPADSEVGGNGVFAYGDADAFPNAGYGATNYWVDVVIAY